MRVRWAGVVLVGAASIGLANALLSCVSGAATNGTACSFLSKTQAQRILGGMVIIDAIGAKEGQAASGEGTSCMYSHSRGESSSSKQEAMVTVRLNQSKLARNHFAREMREISKSQSDSGRPRTNRLPRITKFDGLDGYYVIVTDDSLLGQKGRYEIATLNVMKDTQVVQVVAGGVRHPLSAGRYVVDWILAQVTT